MKSTSNFADVQVSGQQRNLWSGGAQSSSAFLWCFRSNNHLFISCMMLYWCFTSHATIFQLYMWRHWCAGGRKKLYLRSGSKRHRHFVGFFNVLVQAPRRGHPFYGYYGKLSHLVAFYDTLGIQRTNYHLKPPASPPWHIMFEESAQLLQIIMLGFINQESVKT